MAANPILDQQIIDDPHMKPLEWHKARQNYIGASEVGAILGLNPWKSRLEVYLEKVADEPVIIGMNERMRWGLIHEAVIASEFCRRTGLKVQQWSKGYTSKEFPFLRASADRLIIGSEKGTGILEIKTANGFYAKSWEHEVPLMYYAQLMLQMYCSCHDWGAITVLIDGNELHTHWYSRDEDFLAAAVPQLVDFWKNHVEKRIPPEPQNGEDVQKLYAASLPGKFV
ncbi:MAG: YqaJ viral recombinase family protein, partial [Anaerolineae bacterium]|nr:YqaJ viral recombinase family protein [Anaerolineae bacterium]